MAYIDFIIGFVVIMSIITTKVIHELKFDKKTGTYKKKSIKDILFPPILPLHVSPPVVYKKPNELRHSRSMPAIYI